MEPSVFEFKALSLFRADDENGSGKLDKRERPAETCWHIALTASALCSVTGELSGIGATETHNYQYNFQIKSKNIIILIIELISIKSCNNHDSA